MVTNADRPVQSNERVARNYVSDNPAIMNVGALRIHTIPLLLQDGRTLDQNILTIIVLHARTLFSLFSLRICTVVAESDELPVSMHESSSPYIHLVVAVRTFGDDGAAVRP